MGKINIIEQRPVTLTEAKQLMEKIKKRDKALSTRAQKTEEYLNKFAKLSTQEINSIKEKINNLGITRLKDKHIAKIIDIQPKDIDSLRMILTEDNVTLKQEDLQKILECLK